MNDPITLAPLPRTNWVMRGFGIFVVAFGAYIGWSVTPRGRGVLLFVAASAITGLVLLIRGPRMSVTLNESEVYVRGLYTSRSIERASVTGLTEFPSITWTTKSGQERWTPLLAFHTAAGNPDWLKSHNEHAVAQLKKWISHK